jgi:hypothetical protein
MATNSNNQSFLNKSRLDKFIMVFQVPQALKKIESKTERRTYNLNEDAFQFSVYVSVVPEITVPSIQIGYAGSNLYNSAHAKEPYPPVTVNFTVDNEFNNYWTIYKWLDLMHDEKEGLYDVDDLSIDERFASYQTDMTLYGLDEYDNKRIKFTYTKAFPINVGAMNYNYRDSAEIESSMTFVYSQIHSELINY